MAAGRGQAQGGSSEGWTPVGGAERHAGGEARPGAVRQRGLKKSQGEEHGPRVRTEQGAEKATAQG